MPPEPPPQPPPSVPTTLSPPPSTALPPTPPPSPPASILRPIYTALLVTCPIILLLPPRKLDLYTLSLCGVWVVSAEELAFGRVAGAGAPGEKKKGRWFGVRGITTTSTTTTSTGKQSEEGEQDTDDRTKGGNSEEREENEKKAGLSGLLRNLWMGDEKPGWQRRRLEREKEELESGKSYGEMIMEQVWEVFPGFGRGRGDGDGDGGEGREDAGEGEREGERGGRG